MLCNYLVSIIILLIDEGDGNGGSGMEQYRFCDFPFSVTEDNGVGSDDFSFSCANHLRIFTRAAYNKVSSVI